jgi:hypothetical protein
MRPPRRFGATAPDASARERAELIGGCDTPFDGPNREPGAGVCIGACAGCGLLSLRGGRESGGRCTLGVSGYEAGGTFCEPLICLGGRESGGRDVGGREFGIRISGLGVRCATPCAGCWIGCAPVSIFWVGASRLSPARRAPQPPQNRESGSLSVPQLGQRIPPQA